MDDYDFIGKTHKIYKNKEKKRCIL